MCLVFVLLYCYKKYVCVIHATYLKEKRIEKETGKRVTASYLLNNKQSDKLVML